MKKILLIILCISIAVITFGQLWKVKGPDHLVNKTEKALQKTPDTQSFAANPIVGQKFTEEYIGETKYDLQGYGGMTNKIYAYPDGTVGAIWMMAFDEGTWNDRGTGYNYFNGQTWGPLPTERLESGRTGFPCYGPYGENGEITAAHYLPSTDWVILFNKRDTKGEGDWEEFMLEGPESGVGLVWPTIVTNGEDNQTIHVLAESYGNVYNGQTNALLYSRSTDGGLTWDIQNYVFDDLGPETFATIDAEGYAWAEPKGEVLAFAIGFDAGDGYIMKSEDNGENWDQILVYESPYPLPPGAASLPYGGGDGSMAVAIDSQNNAHVVFGRMRHVYDDAGVLNFYPLTEGLIYWNETMDELDSTIVSFYTLDYLFENGNLIGWIVPNNGDSTIIDFDSYQVSLTSFPQITIDDNDNIFVIYSALAAGYDNDLKNFRHIFANSSNDGGQTWNGTIDFNTDLIYLFSECVYPNMSPTMTGSEVHFTFQRDDIPGNAVWLEHHSIVDNDIVYMSYETNFTTGIQPNDQRIETSFELLGIYPNPLRENTSVWIILKKQTNLTVRITDITGRMVDSYELGLLDDGRHEITIYRKNLKAGIYYYSVVADGEALTQKMIVQ
jgi:hypothetical protein